MLHEETNATCPSFSQKIVEMGGRMQKYIKSPNPKIKNQNTKIQDPESKTYS